ncbi:tRNA lysidine(34) synthetase TilS [Prolixibacteraceae bacterium]|nr:tRNA lysidine(34) synthetase TilS [Prolixibacteraceae bacterium]
MIQVAFEDFLYDELENVNCKILLAVSGGIDSMVMADLFVKSNYNVVIANCNFHLRGEESDEDTRLVERYAKNNQVICYLKDFNTRIYAQENSISIEMAARDLRYEWFHELLRENNYDYIATGHHRDDSLETFVLNWSRGTGIKGLTSIRKRNVKVLRPLINISRAEVVSYAKHNNIPFRHDSSNDSDIYLRNIVRHNILPEIDRLNIKARNNMQRSIGYLQQVESVYNWAINLAINDIVQEDSEAIYIDKEKLLCFVSPEQLLFEILQPRGFNSKLVHQVIQTLESSISGKVFYSDSYRLICEREKLYLLQRNSDVRLDFSLKDDSLTCLEEFGYRVSLEEWSRESEVEKNNEIAYVDANMITGKWSVRSWKQGDRFRPLGMKGEKKLSDYFIDRKWSTIKKEKALVLCDGGQIVWLMGERLDDRYKVTSQTTSVYIFMPV